MNTAILPSGAKDADPLRPRSMLHGGKIVERVTPHQMRESQNAVVVQFLSGSTGGLIRKRSKYYMLSSPD